MKIKFIFRLLISLPKTIYFNFKVLPFNQAIRLPILISYNLKTFNLKKNSIIIDSNELSIFMIKMNFDSGSLGVNISNKSNGFLDLKDKGVIIFNGKANFCQGISMRIGNGILMFGQNFQANKDCFISCNKQITFGNDVLLGWSVSLRDSDGHEIINNINNEIQVSNKEINIGDQVWIGANVSVLKGVNIPKNSVVGYGSLVTKGFQNSNSIIAGYPARVIKENISWRG